MRSAGIVSVAFSKSISFHLICEHALLRRPVNINIFQQSRRIGEHDSTVAHHAGKPSHVTTDSRAAGLYRSIALHGFLGKLNSGCDLSNRSYTARR